MSATFSYAQAAKGVSATPVVPSKPTSTEPEKSDAKTEEPSESVPAPTESVTTASETETPQEPETATTSVNNDAEFTTVTSKHAHRSKATNSRTSSPSVRSNAAQSKEGDASNTANGTTDASSEKQAQSDAKADKTENGSETSKEKSEKSEKSEKAEKATPPKELKAAPLPSVNIWQQRKEAQEAKAKSTPSPAAGKGKSEEAQQESGKASSKKKGTDGASEGTKGKKSDGKGRDEALSSVADASSWPTPQVALGEEKKKAQDKTDKPERTDKSPASRSHGKEKWMPVNYVPTAVFNTPLPTPAGRGGRKPTRGGRDGGRGGAHGAGAAAGDKAASGQAAPAKQAPGERGRNETGSSRAASLPAQARRSTSADLANQDARKGQAAERGRGPRGAEDATTNGKQVNGGEHFPRPQRDGKQFPRNHNQDARAGDRNSKNAHLGVDSQAAARANERRVESGPKSADVNRDASGFQDFNRERGDSRAERGGRNANRGRGPYSNFAQNPQFAMANSFVPGKFGFNDRQRSHTGVPSGQQQNNRIPLRSPSLPATAGMYNNVYQFPAEINTMYPSYPANVAPGPMSAMPYQQYMEPFSLMSMLSMQLEYYFSVDNMCKDMFLRRHMDSQGFVPLGVIASFKRVKSMTEDFEMLRHVSRGLRNVDYQIGEDGVDRLRPKESWAQWVLPVDQRDPSAQHEGAPAVKYARNDENAPINNHNEGALNGSIHNGPRQFVPNGTASRGNRTPLSSTAPEFQPAQNEIANVGLPKDHSSLAEESTQWTGSCTPPMENLVIDNHPSACGLSSPPETSHPPECETEWPSSR
jgi:la-related protein 1